MHKILLPSDGSDNSLRAVRFAAMLARAHPGLHLVLLHVLDPVMLGSHAHLSQQQIEQLHASDAEPVLAAARAALDEAGASYEVHCRSGSPAAQITQYVRETGCAAVIMGTRGMGPIASAMVGSVALKTIHLAEVPVTLVK